MFTVVSNQEARVSVENGQDTIIVQPVAVVATPTVGEHGNAWNNETIGANSVSQSVDCRYVSNITFMCSSDTTNVQFMVQASQDNVNFYNVQSSQASIPPNGAASAIIGARYIRVITAGTSPTATVTLTISGKA